jgi:hypothetical protein
MDRLAEARLEWQRAQAELQLALAELERRVAAVANGEAVAEAKAVADQKNDAADAYLNRYITQLGKA